MFKCINCKCISITTGVCGVSVLEPEVLLSNVPNRFFSEKRLNGLAMFVHRAIQVKPDEVIDAVHTILEQL